eukprot:Partr_v1_DN28197_c1_g1_i2_m55191 putative calcium exchanger
MSFSSCATFPVNAADFCRHVTDNCNGLLPGLVDYLDLTYCKLAGNIGLSIFLLILFLACLLMFVGVAASDYFSPNISTLSRILRLSHDVSGVTIVAFGNCAGDLMGNIISFRSVGAGELAVGELLGTGLISICVVVGTIATLGRDNIGLNGTAVVRDCGFYLLAVSSLLIMLIPGRLYWWEGVILLLIYFFYVLTILTMSNESIAARVSHYVPRWFFRYTRPNIDHSTVTRQDSGPAIYIEPAAEPEPVVEPGISPSIVTEQPVADSSTQSPVLNLRAGTPLPTTMSPIELPESISSSLSPRLTTDIPLESLMHRRSRSTPGPSSPIVYSRSLPRPGRSMSPARESKSLALSIPSTSSLSSGAASEKARAKMSLTFRQYTPYLSIPSHLTLPNNVRLRRHNSQSSTSENVVNLQIQERLFENMRINSVAGAFELQGAYNSLRRSSSLDNRQPDELFTSASRLNSTSPEQHGRAFTAEETAESSRILFEAEDTFERCDRCPTCFKCASAADLEYSYSLRRLLLHHIFPISETWKFMSLPGQVVGVLHIIPHMFLSLTVPVISTFADVDETTAPDVFDDSQVPNMPQTAAQPVIVLPNEGVVEWQKECSYGRIIKVPWKHAYISTVQCLLTPLLAVISTGSQLGVPISRMPNLRNWEFALILGAAAASIFLVITRSGKRLLRVKAGSVPCDNLNCAVCFHKRRRKIGDRLKMMFTKEYWRYFQWFPYFSIFGFVNGLMWIYLLNAEIISILKTMGLAMGISDSILGVTIFAAGNTVGDFATNVMIARMGYHSMAIGASWGAPIMNLLLTLGVVLTFLEPPNAVNGSIPLALSPIFMACFALIILVLLMNFIILGKVHKFQLRRSYGIALLIAWTFLVILISLMEGFL